MANAIFGVSSLEDIKAFPFGTWEVGVRANNTAGEGPHSNPVTVTVG